MDLHMIHDVKSGQDLSAQQLAEHLATASHVLVGVQHDNPDHLAVQLWLLQSLVQRRAQGSLLLAMLTLGQQDHVSRVQSAIAHGEYPADLSAALDCCPEWDWAFYGPLVRYALAQPYPLLAANLNPDEAQATRQRLRRMAQELLAAPFPALLLAQADHVRKDIGVPLYMTDLVGKAEPVVLILAQHGMTVEAEAADYVWYTAAPV